jgi:hypothetical protein
MKNGASPWVRAQPLMAMVHLGSENEWSSGSRLVLGALCHTLERPQRARLVKFPGGGQENRPYIAAVVFPR